MAQDNRSDSLRVGLLDRDARVDFRDMILSDIREFVVREDDCLVLGLLDGEEPAGALAGLMEDEGTFRILSLYVEPRSRRRGGGTLLIEAVRRALTEMDKTGETVILADYFDTGADSEALGAFLAATGARANRTGTSLYVTRMGELYGSARFPKGYRPKQAVPVSALSRDARNDLIRSAEGNGFPAGVLHHEKARLSARYSVASYEKDRVVGCILFGNTTDGRLIMQDAWCAPGFENRFPDILRTAVEQFRSAVPPETEILFPVIRQNERNEIPTLLPEAVNVLHETMIVW